MDKTDEQGPRLTTSQQKRAPVWWGVKVLTSNMDVGWGPAGIWINGADDRDGWQHTDWAIPELVDAKLSIGGCVTGVERLRMHLARLWKFE